MYYLESDRAWVLLLSHNGKRNDESTFGAPCFCFCAGWLGGEFGVWMGGFGEAGGVRCERDDDRGDAGCDSRGEGDVPGVGGGLPEAGAGV